MDWQRWHEEYDDPGSRLRRRLDVVCTRLHQVLDERAAPEIRLLSLCAGDARDVTSVLRDRPAGGMVRAVVVERDEELARQARARAAGLDAFSVRCADAGDPATFTDVLPVDVLVLCGIFGNVEPDDVRRFIGRIPSMVRPGAHVIWTRGAGTGGSDPRRQVRGWFAGAGLPEVAFEGAPAPYGVGVNRVTQPSADPLGDDRLFTFVR